MKTLYVSDLDGTLLSPGSIVTPESASMLNEAIRNGAIFSVATARTPSTVSALLKDVNVTYPLIVMTGAALWDPVTGLFSNSITIDHGTSEEILSILREHKLPAFIYRLEGDKIHILHTGSLSDMERKFIGERDHSRYKVFHIPEDGESAIPDPLTGVSLFYSVYPTDIVSDTYLDIKKKVDCNPLFYHDIYGEYYANLEIFSSQTSKANAIRILRQMCGAERVVAFGDNINDIPMLREADVAVAVENAVPEVKRAADIFIGSNKENSVARFILECTRTGNIS